MRGAQKAEEGFHGVSGKQAVDASKEMARMQVRADGVNNLDSEILFFTAAPKPNTPGQGGTGGQGTETVRFIGSRTFYRDGERWVDSTYDGQSETIKTKLFSETYFRLVADYPETAKYFALGNHVVVVIGDKAYETVE